jgi:hypothetical protein
VPFRPDDPATEWDAFPDLPGIHLSWRRSKGRVRELLSAEGRVWAKARPPVESRHFWVSVGSHTYIVETDDRRRGTQFNLVDQHSMPALAWRGRHFNHNAGTRLKLLDGTSYRFPVRGTFAKPTMWAVADHGDGRPMISYRLKPALLRRKGRPTLAITTNRQDYSVEVVVRPEAQHSIPSVPLFVAITSHLLRRFFRSRAVVVDAL